MEQIELTHGPLSFTTHTCGSASAPVVLCLHGFPDNPHTFRHLLHALAEAGYRGVAPTMRGYEPSSQPENGDYTIGSMVEDVLAWIDGLGVEQVHLVGHDWGAVVAYVAAAVAPQRFSSLTTMAVPHTLRISQGVRRVPSQVFKVWYQGFFQLRGPAEWALKRNDWALVKRLCATWSPGFSLDEVIEKVTCAPAAAMGMATEIGSLRKGSCADISIIELEAGTFDYTDAHGETRIGEQKLIPVSTIRGGRLYPPSAFANRSPS